MKITAEQLNAACEALLNAMDENGFDTFCPSGEYDPECVGMASSGDIRKSLAAALNTLGITVE
jgi:hypothetical protein